jgi:hypothetical protein
VLWRDAPVNSVVFEADSDIGEIRQICPHIRPLGLIVNRSGLQILTIRQRRPCYGSALIFFSPPNGYSHWLRLCGGLKPPWLNGSIEFANTYLLVY